MVNPFERLFVALEEDYSSPEPLSFSSLQIDVRLWFPLREKLFEEIILLSMMNSRHYNLASLKSDDAILDIEGKSILVSDICIRYGRGGCYRQTAGTA